MHNIALALLFAITFNASDDRIAAGWQKRIGTSIEALKRADYDRSLDQSNWLLRDMILRLGPGDENAKVIGLVLTHKAVALAGLGKPEDALWYWQMALNLYPAYAKSDLSALGEPGKFLTANRELRPIVTEREQYTVPPMPIKKPLPEYPPSAVDFDVEGQMIVQVTVTPDGKVTHPRIVEALPAPSLSYAALEAMRRWEFQAARKDGERVESTFTIALNCIIRGNGR
jgi:TonB family protein